MPSKNPATGKEYTGAEKKAKKRELLDEAAREEADDADVSWAEDFKQAGEPDLENAGTDLDYVRKLQLICLKQVATTPNPTKAQTACWARIKEMAAVVGMTSNRAQLETKCKKLEKALSARTANAHAGIARLEPGAKVKRPSTARGAAPPGPRAIPPDALPPDDDED